PAEEEAHARITQPSLSPELPQRDGHEGRPGPDDRREVLRVEERVIVPWSPRVSPAACKPAGQVVHVAPDQVLLDERVSPASPGDRVPPEPEQYEYDHARGCDEPAHPAQVALPEQEEAHRRYEEGRRDGAFRERSKGEQDERSRGVAPPILAPPAVRATERQREQQHEEHVGPGTTGMRKERAAGGEHDARHEPRRRAGHAAPGL